MEANENVSHENLQVKESIAEVLKDEQYGLTMLDLSVRLDQNKIGVYPEMLVETVKEMAKEGVLVSGSLTYKLKGFATLRRETVMLADLFKKNGK
jgi:hypothetical protein